MTRSLYTAKGVVPSVTPVVQDLAIGQRQGGAVHCGRLELQARRRHHGGRAGQRLLVAGIVGEGDPHPDGLAHVSRHYGVGGAGGAGDIRVFGQPLILEDRVISRPSVSAMAVVSAESVCPTSGIPLMRGSPSAGVFDRDVLGGRQASYRQFHWMARCRQRCRSL